MEDIDSDLQILKAENVRLRSLFSNPEVILKKAGLIRTGTPFAEDLIQDPFRNDEGLIMKNENNAIVPETNEAYHAMSWDDIHEMATAAKDMELIP